MKLFKIFILITLFISCSSEVAEKDSISFSEKNYDEAFQLIEYWLNAQKDYENLTGLTAMVGDEDGIIWSEAFGMANEEDLMSVENTFSICSISKLFTSIAIMKLIEEKKIALNDPINKLLPWFDLKQQFENSPPLTIKSILTHSSGLPRESNHPYWSWPDFPFPSKEDVVKELKNQEMLYPSSKYYQYSNLGLSLLGYVVEEVSGESFEDYINKNILEPLNMKDTKTYMSEEDYGELLSIGYSSIKRDRNRDKVNFFNADGIAAAAGFTSNVEDIAKFAAWQMKLLNSLEKNIISSETLKEMHKVSWDDELSSVKRGLGFGVYDFGGERWVGHGGSCPGYRSQLYLNPEMGISYSVMINSSGTNPGKYIQGIHQILKKVTLKKEKLSNKFKEIEGIYIAQPWGSETYIQSWGNHLALLRMPSTSPELTLYKKVEIDVFKRILKNGELGEKLEILRDQEEGVIGFKSHQNIYSKSK
jgi:CubicO group peptidase (beta-lactamase class C family)|tara:strand:- start:377 stop:1804 length:1428 start_codon:yes stop_codon:yes gene_type:complete